MAAEPRKPLDWEAIERDYRAGIYSIREVGRLHDLSDAAIRKHAKANGWERDLAAKVKALAKTKLVRTLGSQDGSQSQPANDDEIADSAARVQVELVRSHQRSLARASGIINKLLGELDDGTDNRAEIEEEIELETAKDRNPQRRSAMLRAVSLPVRAQTLRELSQTIKNTQPLERLAFGLENGVPDGGEETPQVVNIYVPSNNRD